MPRVLLGFLCCASSLAVAAPPHQHGAAVLEIVLDGAQLIVELAVPAHDVVGFEHAPDTPGEKVRAATAIAELREVRRVLTLSAEAACKEQSVRVDADLLSAAALPEPPLASADRHTEGFGHADQHDAHHCEHSEVRFIYEFECAVPAALSGFTTGLFELLPGLTAITVRTFTAQQPREQTLRRPHTRVDF